MSNFAHANKGTTYTVNHYLATKHIGIWCNGNTTDSGPVILGSSPSIPTKQSLFITNRLFFVFSPIPHSLDQPYTAPTKNKHGYFGLGGCCL